MRNRINQTGFAAVETVIVTPILILLFVIIVDFGRVMYYSISTASAARNAAAMGSRVQLMPQIQHFSLTWHKKMTLLPTRQSNLGNCKFSLCLYLTRQL